MLELQLPTFSVEAMLPDFWIKASFKPLGPMLSYVNDKTRTNVRLEDVELLPLAGDRQVACIKQAKVTIEKSNLLLISVTDQEQAQSIQVLQSHRPVIFYLSHFAVQGELHVNADSRDDDLMDDARDFCVLTDVTLFPLRQLGPTHINRKIPLLLVNQRYIQTYHVQPKKE